MTKTELLSALAEATQTDKRAAGVFLETLSALAYKEIKKEWRIRRAWIWQARKAEEEGTHRDKSQDTTEDQDSRQNCAEIPCREGGKGRGSGGKEVDRRGSLRIEICA